MKPFISLTVLACLIAAFGAAAQSIDSFAQPGLVAPADLGKLGSQLGQCLGRRIDLLEHQVRGRGDRLTIELQPNGTDADPAARFTVGMRYNQASTQWEPANLYILGSLSEPSLNPRGIRTQGLVSGAEARALHAAISGYWAERAGRAAIRLDSIISSRLPALSCESGDLAPRGADVHYDVMVTDSDLPTLNDLTPPQGGRIVDVGGQQTAPLYHFQLRRAGGDGPLEVLRVRCEAFPSGCDEQVMAGLQGGEVVEENPLDNAELRAAMLLALPPAFHQAEMSAPQTLWRADRETVVVQLKEVPMSAVRRAASVVSCRRFLSAPADWECEHRVTGETQTIQESGLVVRLAGKGIASEEEVVTLMDVLAARLGEITMRNPILRVTPDGGYHVRFFWNEGNITRGTRQAWFSGDLALQRLE